MLVRVDDIKDGGLAFDFSQGTETFPALQELDGPGEAKFREPVRVRGRAQKITDLIEVEGEIATAVDLECGRCLNPFRQPLVIPFAITFSRELPTVSAEDNEGEVELTPEEMGLIPFSGDEFSLVEAVQEQLLMAVPLRPLCRRECQGLCPQCGVDWNQATCDCEPPHFNGRFAALKGLKVNKE